MGMGILYGMVARGQTVLAEFSCPTTITNAGAISRQILEKLPSGNADSNASFSQGRHVFHIKRTDGLTVLCMADDAFESESASPSRLISTCTFPSHAKSYIISIYLFTTFDLVHRYGMFPNEGPPIAGSCNAGGC